MKSSSYAKPSSKNKDTFRTSEGSLGMNRRPIQRQEPMGHGEDTFTHDVRVKPSKIRGRLLKVINGCDIVDLKDEKSNLYSYKPKEPKCPTSMGMCLESRVSKRAFWSTSCNFGTIISAPHE